jgi:hypothetical protein
MGEYGDFMIDGLPDTGPIQTQIEATHNPI